MHGTNIVETGTECQRPLTLSFAESQVLWEVALTVGQAAYHRTVELIEGMLQFSLSVSF